VDTLTHALSGALLARASAPARGALRLRSRVALGFAAAAFPDADIVMRLAGTLTYLDTHRGVTHSLIMLPLWAAGVAFVAWLLGLRGRAVAEVGLVCALGIGIHILGDVITAYGTMVFAPLSTWRATYPVTFIIDPYFTAILVLGLIAAWRWRRQRGPAVAALAVLCAYVGGQALARGSALELARAHARTVGETAARVHVMPQPLSPFNWKLIVEHGQVYEESYASLWRTAPLPAPGPEAGMLARIDAAYRPAGDLHWTAHARYGRDASERSLVQAAWDAPELAVFRRFALYAVLDHVERAPRRTCVWFADLRFTLQGRRTPFRYGVCRPGEGASWTLVPGL